MNARPENSDRRISWAIIYGDFVIHIAGGIVPSNCRKVKLGRLVGLIHHRIPEHKVNLFESSAHWRHGSVVGYSLSQTLVNDAATYSTSGLWPLPTRPSKSQFNASEVCQDDPRSEL